MTTWTPINNDDEVELSCRARGHRYIDGDIIVGRFRLEITEDGDTWTREETVRFEQSHGCCGYVAADGEPMSGELVAWREATREECERFEEGGDDE